GDREARAGGQALRGGDDIRGAGGVDLLPAAYAVNDAGAGEQQAQVIDDLGERADGGTRPARGEALADGDRGREVVEAVGVRLVEAFEELPRVGGEALQVAALGLGVEGVEGERRLARAT